MILTLTHKLEFKLFLLFYFMKDCFHEPAGAGAGAGGVGAGGVGAGGYSTTSSCG